MFRSMQKFLWSLRGEKWRREQEQIGFDSVDEHDTFDAGYHGLPAKKKLEKMSFSQLAMELQNHKLGSAAYLVVQREMKLKEDPSFWVKHWVKGVIALIGVVAGLAAKLL